MALSQPKAKQRKKLINDVAVMMAERRKQKRPGLKKRSGYKPITIIENSMPRKKKRPMKKRPSGPILGN